MAKNTKKRLVTGLACTVPAVIAVPSLLALTQCGSQTSTQHIKLSGTTKKEDTKTVIQEQYKYELILENVDDPSTVQVALPNVSINGKKIEGSKKYSLYKSTVQANGVVTIIFYRDEIIEASRDTVSNDEAVPFEVKFDVNLKNDQFNETLSNFTLDIKIPEFNVDTKTEMKNVTIETTQAKATYLTDYEATILPKQYYTLDGDDVVCHVWSDIDNEGEPVDLLTYENEEGEKAATFNKATGKLVVKGWAIKNEIQLEFKAEAKKFNIDCSGIEESYFTIVGLPEKAQYGVTINCPLNWTTPGHMISESKVEVEDEEGTRTTIENAEFDNDHIKIDGKDITGKIYLSCTFNTAEFDAGYDKETSDEHVTFDGTDGQGNFNAPAKYGEDYVVTFKYKNKGHKVTDSTVQINGKDLDPKLYTIVNEIDPETQEVTGKLTIPGKYVTNTIGISINATTLMKHKLVATTGSTHVKFESKASVNWGEDTPVNFEKLDRGYAIDSTNTKAEFYLNGTKTHDIRWSLIGADEELATGIKLVGADMTGASEGEVRLSTTTKVIERTITNNHDDNSRWSINAEEQHPTVESTYIATIKPDDGFEIDNIKIGRKPKGGTEYTEQLAEGTDFTYENNILTINEGAILGDCKIFVETKHLPRKVSTSQLAHAKWYDSNKNEITGKTDKAFRDETYVSYFIPADEYHTFEGVQPTVRMKKFNGEWLEDFQGFTFKKDTDGFYKFEIISQPKASEQITGDIEITIDAAAIGREFTPVPKTTGKVTYSVDELAKKPSADQDLVATYHAKDGYHFEENKKPSIVIEGYSKTIDPNWSIADGGKTATLTVACKNAQGETQITGNITATLDAELTKTDIKVNTDAYISKTITDESLNPITQSDVEHDVIMTFTPATHYVIDTTKVTAKIGGKDLFTEFGPKGEKWNWQIDELTGIGVLTIDKSICLGQIDVNVSSTGEVVNVTFPTLDTTKTKQPTVSENPSITNPLVVKFEPADSKYEIVATTPAPKYTINGEQQTATAQEWNWQTGTLTIPAEKILGDISIDFNCSAVVRTVTYLEEDGTTPAKTYSGKLTDESKKPSYDQGANLTITKAEGYELSATNKPKVYIGDAEDPLADSEVNWDPLTGVLLFAKEHITDDIKIKFTAKGEESTVSVTTTNCQTGTYPPKLYYGEKYECVFKPDEYSEITASTTKPEFSINGGESWASITTIGGTFVNLGGTNGYKLTIPATHGWREKAVKIRFTADPVQHGADLTGVKNCKISEVVKPTYQEGAKYTFDVTDYPGYEWKTAEPVVYLGTTESTPLVRDYDYEFTISGKVATLEVYEEVITDKLIVQLTPDKTTYEVDSTKLPGCDIVGDPATYVDGYTATITPQTTSGWGLPYVVRAYSDNTYSTESMITSSWDKNTKTFKIGKEIITGTVYLKSSYKVSAGTCVGIDDITGDEEVDAQTKFIKSFHIAEGYTWTGGTVKVTINGEEIAPADYTVQLSQDTVIVQITEAGKQLVKGDVVIEVKAVEI